MSNYLGWSNDQIEDLVNRIYGGKVSRKKLPKDLYKAIVDRMTDALLDGFGDFGVAGETARISLIANVEKFAAAKVFQTVNDISNWIVNSEGELMAFGEFKKVAVEIFDVYNDAWLKTEHSTLNAQIQQAENWLLIQEQKDALPYLRYSTVGDERVRASHEELDGIIRKVDDAFWDTYYPINDWNCRCIVEQLSEGEETDLESVELEKPPKNFRNNVGKTNVVFDENDHPYFKVDPMYTQFKDKNFGL